MNIFMYTYVYLHIHTHTLAQTVGERGRPQAIVSQKTNQNLHTYIHICI